MINKCKTFVNVLYIYSCFSFLILLTALIATSCGNLLSDNYATNEDVYDACKERICYCDEINIDWELYTFNDSDLLSYISFVPEYNRYLFPTETIHAHLTAIAPLSHITDSLSNVNPLYEFRLVKLFCCEWYIVPWPYFIGVPSIRYFSRRIHYESPVPFTIQVIPPSMWQSQQLSPFIHNDRTALIQQPLAPGIYRIINRVTIMDESVIGWAEFEICNYTTTE